MVNIPEIVTEPLDRNNLASLNKKKTAPISKENVFILNARTRRVDDPVQAAPRQPTQQGWSQPGPQARVQQPMPQGRPQPGPQARVQQPVPQGRLGSPSGAGEDHNRPPQPDPQKPGAASPQPPYLFLVRSRRLHQRRRGFPTWSCRDSQIRCVKGRNLPWIRRTEACGRSRPASAGTS